jgi:hypothetical protein
MHIITRFAITAAFSLISVTVSVAADTAPEQSAVLQLQLHQLKSENDSLAAKIKQLETIRSISPDSLKYKKAQKLKEISSDIKAQRRTTNDFEGFFKWMSDNLAGYNQYIQAGSYAAVFARMLPIPYAGQASIFTKFLAQFTVSLNEASVSVTNYMNSSWKFIVMADAIDLTKEIDENKVAEAASFADQQMLKDMNHAKNKLAAVSSLSSGALSFLESVNSYVSSTDEYWNKAKGLFKKNVDPKERSYLSESISNLKGQADLFNSRLMQFEQLGDQETTAVKSLAVYDELAALAQPIAADRGVKIEKQ